MVRTYQRAAVAFAGTALSIASFIATLRAVGYTGSFWVVIGYPAVPVLWLLSEVLPEISNNTAHVAVAGVYGVLAAVWWLPLPDERRITVYALTGVYCSIIVYLLLLNLARHVVSNDA